MCAKNYENIMRFDKVITKIIRVQLLFFPHSVQLQGVTKNCDFRSVSHFISETIQDMAIVTMEYE